MYETIEKNSDYIIIDDFTSIKYDGEYVNMSYKDKIACMYQITQSRMPVNIQWDKDSKIAFSKDYEIWSMEDFITECVWNGYNPPSYKQINSNRYNVRTQYTPAFVYAYCWELDKYVEQQLDNWTERLVPVYLYERATNSHSIYKSGWDNITIDTYETPSEDRLFVNKWYRAFGIDLSAPPISSYQPNNDITTFGNRSREETYRHRIQDAKHATRAITKPINYHLNVTTIASDKEIDNAKMQIKYYISNMSDEMMSEDYRMCPCCNNAPIVINPCRSDYSESGICEDCEDKNNK